MNYSVDDQPLGLAVHSLPNPQDAAQTPSLATGRWKLLVIAVLCSIPLFAAYIAFLFMQPEGHADFGEFIRPVRPVGSLQGVTLDGVNQPLAQHNGRWLLVSVTDGACAAQCQRQLFIQRQLRETLGDDKQRVARVWLIDDAASVPAPLREAMGEATILRVSSAALKAWLALPDGKALNNYLYVVDPQGNAMMRFPAQVDVEQAGRIRRDLERLLRATAIWTPTPQSPT